MSGHPPFGAQVILNGHEYVACQAHAAGIRFAKEGNCFTRIGEPDRLAQVADTLSQPGTIGRPTLRTLFRPTGTGSGPRWCRRRAGGRPRWRGEDLSPRQAIVIERPRWNLALFKVHFGLLTLKGYTKGEHVLRFEAIVHNTNALHTGRVLEKFPTIVARLAAMVNRFTSMLDCVDVGFLPDGILDQLPATANRPNTHNRVYETRVYRGDPHERKCILGDVETVAYGTARGRLVLIVNIA